MRRRSSWARAWLGMMAAATGAGAAEPPPEPRGFDAEVRPILVRVCHECHAGDRVEGDLDLAALAASWDEARKHPRAWQKVGAMLDGGQMPPKDSPQPTDRERTRLRDWVRGYLAAEARAHAGDPGPVGLRRLNNAEYTYTVRDLTGVDTLDPAREFPVDGAAGEGFTNAGNALAMSPALVAKYLDAAKGIAAHAVPLPDGFRFSASSTPNDWTNEALARVQDFYREFTDDRGGNAVNVQGHIFQTNQGGRLPLDRYLAATLAIDRAAWRGDGPPAGAIGKLVREHKLSPKYLASLGRLLASDADPASGVSPAIDALRAGWRSAAGPGDAAGLAAGVEAWHPALWRFNTVGHIGKVGGPKSWMEPASPIVARQEVRHKFPASAAGGEVVVTLAVGEAGDGAAGDVAVWERPRLVAPGRPDILLRDARAVARDLSVRRERLVQSAARCLTALDEISRSDPAAGAVDLAALAGRHGVAAADLAGWAEALGLATGESALLGDPIGRKLQGVPGGEGVRGWVGDDALSLLANPGDRAVNIPGTIPPRGVAVHPTPTRSVVVGWRSPVAASVRVSARVQDAHTACGNGVTWSLELRRGRTRQVLGSGVTEAANPVAVAPAGPFAVRPGDALALVIGPRDGSHVCDLTAVDLKVEADGATWDLAADVAPDPLAGNPHADRQGRPGVWHFNSESTAPAPGAILPAGSSLARWRDGRDPAERARLAGAVRAALADPAPPAGPDADLRRTLLDPGGPLFLSTLRPDPAAPPAPAGDGGFGVDPARFGDRAEGTGVDPTSLVVRGASAVVVRLPAELAAGAELVAGATLHPAEGTAGSVQFRVVDGAAGPDPTLRPEAPVVAVAEPARARVEAGFAAVRAWFPAALCYTKIVPIDEAVTLVLLHREDDALRRLILDDEQAARLDRLWDELHFLDQDALKLVDVFTQLLEFASQDADPSVFEPMRRSILDRADAFRRRLRDAEPKQLDALVRFAAQAYRRPLAPAEDADLRALYARLRSESLPHDEAFRLTLARVLVAPAFLLRAEQATPGMASAPVSGRELATRLSYFLWSGPPDRELLDLAESGRLADPDVLAAQARRMVRDGRVRRFAAEFGAQWLHVYRFDQHDEKSERHFPDFARLRSAMNEETVRFLADLFASDRSVLDVLDADRTFLNEDLAKHYAILDVAGPEWREVAGIKARGRGGVLAQATTLAAQSGASRTSPTLRGNWISEVLLGERLPRPPKGVPQLPDDEAATEGLTVRQLVEQHAQNPKCATCHVRIDPLGFALEAFDPVGRLRARDLGDRPIDAQAKAADGVEFAGLDGLRNYLLTNRRDAFVRQFCRKLLGYALGRAVQLSDEPLLDEMQSALASRDHAVGAALEVVVRSRPFREIRGRDRALDEE